MTDTKDATGAANPDNIDDDDSSIITASKAKELIQKELTEANNIGTVDSKATVDGGTDDAATGKTTFKITKGYATVADTLSFNLHVGADADMTNKINVNIDSMDSASLGIKGLNIKDDSGNAATYAVDAISDAMDKGTAIGYEHGPSVQAGLLTSQGIIESMFQDIITNGTDVKKAAKKAENQLNDLFSTVQ